MQVQKVKVYSILNKFGSSKRTGKDYNFYQALIEADQKSFKNVEAFGIKLDEIFIPESEFEALKKHGIFPVECDAKYTADFGSNRLQITQLSPIK